VRGHLLDPWRARLAELAELPNVVGCKVSGLVTEADHANWTPADLEPYVTHALRVFGEDRVMFGGDWPVVTLASTYARWVQTLDQLTSELSATGKRKLWADNARRIYRL
jgi:L-fuconolactonase